MALIVFRTEGWKQVMTMYVVVYINIIYDS